MSLRQRVEGVGLPRARGSVGVGGGALSGESQPGNEKALEMLGGPPNCTPKIFKMINFMLRIFCHKFFQDGREDSPTHSQAKETELGCLHHLSCVFTSPQLSANSPLLWEGTPGILCQTGSSDLAPDALEGPGSPAA